MTSKSIYHNWTFNTIHISKVAGSAGDAAPVSLLEVSLRSVVSPSGAEVLEGLSIMGKSDDGNL